MRINQKRTIISEENEVICTQPPICKKIFRSIDVKNISSASLMKIKVKKKYTISQARGIKSPHDHRNSTKCLFYKFYLLFGPQIVKFLPDSLKCNVLIFKGRTQNPHTSLG